MKYLQLVVTKFIIGVETVPPGDRARAVNLVLKYSESDMVCIKQRADECNSPLSKVAFIEEILKPTTLAEGAD